MTSSSFFTFAKISEICNAAVPFTVAIANLLPTVFANSFSKVSTYFPTLYTNVESIQSFKYFFSFPINLGSCNGINSCVLKVSFIKSTIFAYYIFPSRYLPVSL